MRQRLPWLLALPLMAAGSYAAHSLGLLLGPAENTHEAAEQAGNAALPPASGLLAAVLLVWIGRWLFTRRSSGAGATWFLTLPLLGWSLQEAIERIVDAESAPFPAALEPEFLLGLLLQVPFALTAYLLARALLAIARRLFAPPATPPQPRQRLAQPSRPLYRCELPRVGSLAVGRSGRGPPLLAS